VADSFDEIAKRLQDAIFEGYSQRLKEELFNAENIGAIENPDGHARITGVCGDTIEMFARVQDGKVHDIKFVTDGCGFTVACANYVARTATGKTVDEALGIEPDDIDRYFEGLPDENKHCAKLAVMTLRALIDDYHNKLTG
jgi:nitrogen fixation NifU-like protein